MDIVFPPTDLMPHQNAVLKDAHRFKVLVWHRRARKTSTAMVEMINHAIRTVGVYWHIFPTYSEAKEALWTDPNMFFRICPPELIKDKNQNEMMVRLINGSIIKLKGADDPDHLRGAGPLGIIFDEFQKQKIEAWQTIEPALRENEGWAWFIGTPRGKNHLYDFWKMGNGSMAEWKSWRLKASESGVLSPQALDIARKTAINEAFYNQEYEVAFIEGMGSVFRDIMGVMRAKEQRPIEGHYYVCGVDVARVHDWTVVTVFDRTNNAQVYQDRFQAPWKEQVDRIAKIAKTYNGAICVMDATGIGDSMVEFVGREGVGVEPVVFTAIEKRDMVEKLAVWIQDKSFSLIPNQDTIFELENFSYKISKDGKIKYQAPDGEKYYDDIVMSIALAVKSLNKVLKPEVTEPETWLQSYKKNAINSMYNQDEQYFENLAEWERM